MSERVVIGIVRRTRGVHGELVVESLTDLPNRFEELEHVYLVTPMGTEDVTIEQVRYKNGTEVWLSLAEITDRPRGRSLRGATLEIDIDRRPDPPEGTYYYDQLEGLDVYDTHERHLGRLTRVYPRGGQDVYGVTTAWGEVLVPATDAIIKSIDLRVGRMVIDPPAGLMEPDHAD